MVICQLCAREYRNLIREFRYLIKSCRVGICTNCFKAVKKEHDEIVEQARRASIIEKYTYKKYDMRIKRYNMLQYK